jgi:asparagine synthase (glutamine-hydrolysing)
MTIALPQLTLLWQPGSALSLVDGQEFTGNTLAAKNFHPRPVAVKAGGRTAVVVGSAILGEKIDPEGVGRFLLSARDLAEAARAINGQFLIFLSDPDAGSLSIISDRHTGIPFYWAHAGGGIAGAFLYSDLVRHLRRIGEFASVPEHLFEFLWLQRLLMDKTHDSRSRLLPAATILTVDAKGSRQQRYWRPDFTKNRARNSRASGGELVERLRQSLARRTSDNKRYGLFLSGGHDSRTVLAAMPSAPDCFTVGYSDNYEVGCARKLADIAEAPFHFLKLAPDHLHRFANDAASLCGGLYSIDHALFLGHDREVAQRADVVFHGHGIDYMYQGMYLPARNVAIAGRPTFFRKLTEYPGDLASAFNNGISFRLKYVDLMSLIRPDWRTRLTDYLQASAQAVIADSADVAQSDADRWEYFLIHALGRHFSWPNIGSKMVGVEQRTPSFDNDLFDFYLSLPPEQRVTAAALRRAQIALNRKMAMVPTGNWGIPAAYSPASKTAWLVARKALRHLTGISSLRGPQAQDRTWPDRDVHLTSEPGWRGRVAEALQDEELETSLPFLDWPALRGKAQDWMTTPSGGASLLVELLSVQLFLKATR